MIFKLRNQGKTNSGLHGWLFCLSSKYKYCDESYFHFWFQESMIMLFVNKKTEGFSMKKGFSVKFVNQMGLF